MATDPGNTGGRRGAMTHRERVQAALLGEPVDRTPIALWRHFPGRDGAAEMLTEATLEFQRLFDVDLVKLIPTGMYSVMDYGVQIRLADGVSGSTSFVSGPIRQPADWGRLREASPAAGSLKEHVDVVRRVRAELGQDTPIVQTVFSPLTMAAKLVGGDLSQAIVEHEDLLRQGLERMAQDAVAFGRACLDAGADGIFYASQHATRGALPAGTYQRLGVPYDLKILEALRPGAWCTILHLHGVDPLFELADLYPVDAVNWHDRDSEPSLAQALQRTHRGLVGGISREGPVAWGRPEEVAAEVRDAVEQTAGRRLIVGPSCVLPTTAAVENLLAARREVDQ